MNDERLADAEAANAFRLPRLHDRADAEDLVQEALLRAFLDLAELRDRDRFVAWLMGIVVNLAKTRLRMRREVPVEDWSGGRAIRGFAWIVTWMASGFGRSPRSSGAGRHGAAIAPGARSLAARAGSRAGRSAWAPPPCSAKAYRAYLQRLRELVGVILNEIVRGPFRSAYLGDYAFVPHAGQGYMTQALTLVLRWAFRELHLHRMEANIQPGDEASRTLVRRIGCRRGGFSRRYLKIAGQWRDHQRWALLAEDWRGRPSSKLGVRRSRGQGAAHRRRRRWSALP